MAGVVKTFSPKVETEKFLTPVKLSAVLIYQLNRILCCRSYISDCFQFSVRLFYHHVFPRPFKHYVQASVVTILKRYMVWCCAIQDSSIDNQSTASNSFLVFLLIPGCVFFSFLTIFSIFFHSNLYKFFPEE